MTKLNIYEFGCRNMLHLIFQSFFYCLNQRSLVETIFYSEMVKPNIVLKKLKQEKKKWKRKKVRLKQQC